MFRTIQQVLSGQQTTDRQQQLLSDEEQQRAQVSDQTPHDAAPASTGAIATALQQRPWYKPTPQEAIALSMGAMRDIPWVIMTSRNLNYRFEKTDNFGEQSLAQLLWASVVVIGTTIPVAYCWGKHFGISFPKSAKYAAIASAATLSSMIPWNYMDKLGKEFFMSKGFDDKKADYLCSVFPGPGLAEAIMLTVTTSVLSNRFDPDYKFSGMEFVLGVSPINWSGGDLWKIMLLVLQDISESSTAGLIGQAATVALSVFVASYFAMKITAAIVKACQKPETPEVSEDYVDVARRNGSPIHASRSLDHSIEVEFSITPRAGLQPATSQ
jgi:hypothetical protein